MAHDSVLSFRLWPIGRSGFDKCCAGCLAASQVTTGLARFAVTCSRHDALKKAGALQLDTCNGARKAKRLLAEMIAEQAKEVMGAEVWAALSEEEQKEMTRVHELDCLIPAPAQHLLEGDVDGADGAHLVRGQGRAGRQRHDRQGERALQESPQGSSGALRIRWLADPARKEPETLSWHVFQEADWNRGAHLGWRFTAATLKACAEAAAVAEPPQKRRK